MLNSDNAFRTIYEEQEAPAVGPQHHWEQVISHVVLVNQLQWSCLSTAASRQSESADLGECIIANALTEPGSVPRSPRAVSGAPPEIKRPLLGSVWRGASDTAT